MIAAGLARPHGGGQGHEGVDGAGLACAPLRGAQGPVGPRGAGLASPRCHPVVSPQAQALARVGGPGLHRRGVRRAGSTGAHRRGLGRVGVGRAVLTGPRGVVEGAGGAGDAVGQGLATAGHVPGGTGAFDGPLPAVGVRGAWEAGRHRPRPPVRQEGPGRARVAGCVRGPVLVVPGVARAAPARAVGLIPPKANTVGGAGPAVQQGGLVQPACPAPLGPRGGHQGVVRPGQAGGAGPGAR
eukprot:767463-Hanusia_phi.AAC.1